MFAKVFAQIFDSSISEDHLVRLVFTDLLTLSDRHGHIDITPKALSRRTNVPLEVVVRGLTKLSQPDPKSRSKAEEGRRIIPLDSHREWGWKIVNYEQYRDMRDENARREYMRDLMKVKRASKRSKKQQVRALAGVSAGELPLAYADIDVDIDIDKNKTSPSEGKPSPDIRYVAFVDLIDKYWKHKNPSTPFSFGAADGSNLKRFLKDNPKITAEDFKNILQNRARSEAVVHTESLRKWITNAMSYAAGPLDRFGKLAGAAAIQPDRQPYITKLPDAGEVMRAQENRVQQRRAKQRAAGGAD